MRELIAGEGGSVLVAAATSPDAVALACEGFGPAAATPSGVPVFDAAALPGDLDVDVVRMLPCEKRTRAALEGWAAERSIPVAQESIRVVQQHGSTPLITVSAASTGSGKTALTRRIARTLVRSGVPAAVVRHPLATLLHWDRFDPRTFRTPPELNGPVEEREELAPLLGAGIPVVCGLDVSRAVRIAQAEADVVVWDGGGASEPYLDAAMSFLVVDLLRGSTLDEDRVRRSDVVVLTKADAVPANQVEELEARVREIDPDATVVLADLAVGVQPGGALTDRDVVIVEDANSVLLGGLSGGAGIVAARRFRCGVVDPRPFAVGAIASALEGRPDLSGIVPSLGRTPAEIEDLAASVRATPGEVILWASNADPAFLDDPRPVVRAYGELTEVAGPSLQEVLGRFLPGHAA